MIRRVGYDKIAPIARMMGLGQKFDLPLATQRYGTVPDFEWKLRKYKTKWTVADGLNASIGQGYVLAKPLQLAVMAARLASGARCSRAALASRPPRRTGAAARSEHLAIVRDAMYGVVNQGGTGGAARLLIRASPSRHEDGTAQVRRITMAERRAGVLKNGQLPFKLRDHACSSASPPPTIPAMPPRSCSNTMATPSATSTPPMIGRDIMDVAVRSRPRDEEPR